MYYILSLTDIMTPPSVCCFDDGIVSAENSSTNSSPATLQNSFLSNYSDLTIVVNMIMLAVTQFLIFTLFLTTSVDFVIVNYSWGLTLYTCTSLSPRDRLSTFDSNCCLGRVLNTPFVTVDQRYETILYGQRV